LIDTSLTLDCFFRRMALWFWERPKAVGVFLMLLMLLLLWEKFIFI
jgi:hypothetical protein